jgi:hypothetical protein
MVGDPLVGAALRCGRSDARSIGGAMRTATARMDLYGHNPYTTADAG